MDRHKQAFKKFKNKAMKMDEVEKVTLFGSVARDSHGVESDVDIFVKVSEDSVRDKLEKLGFETSLEEEVSVTVIVKESFKGRLGRKVLEEGVEHVRS